MNNLATEAIASRVDPSLKKRFKRYADKYHEGKEARALRILVKDFLDNQDRMKKVG